MVVPEGVHGDHVEEFAGLREEAFSEFLHEVKKWDPDIADVETALGDFDDGQDVVTEGF